MHGIANVTLIGRVGKEPTIKKTDNDFTMARFNLAVNHKVKGEQETDWITVSSWNSLAEIVQNHVKKGMLVAVSGDLRIRDYTDKENVQRKIVEVKARTISFLSGNQNEQSKNTAPEDDDVPF